MSSTVVASEAAKGRGPMIAVIFQVKAKDGRAGDYFEIAGEP